MKFIGLKRLAGLALAAVVIGGALAGSAFAQPAATGPAATLAPEAAAPATAPAALTAAPATPDAAAAAPAVAAPAAAAAAPPKIDTGDTAWMLTSSVLVLMMTIPGLALFYAGMVRKKNILATLAQSFAATALITVLWMVIGYSIAFTDGGKNQAFIGGVKYLLLGPMGLNSTSALA